MKNIVQLGAVEKRICLVRGQKVILDRDLAAIYGVSTRRLNEQVKAMPVPYQGLWLSNGQTQQG